MGGNAAYDASSNAWTAPTYEVKNAAGNVVGDSVQNVGAALTNLNNYVNQGFNIGNNEHTKISTVTPSNQVNFVNGNQTVANVTTDTNGNTNISFDFNNSDSAFSPVVFTLLDGTKVYKVAGKFYDNPNGNGSEISSDDVISALQNGNGSTSPNDPARPLAHIGSSIALASVAGDANYPALNKLAQAANSPTLMNNAVNVGDLHKTVKAVTQNMGDILGIEVNPDGSVKIPDLKIGDNHFNNFTDAINKLGEGWNLTVSVGSLSSADLSLNAIKEKAANGEVAGASRASIQPSETVKFLAGNNIKLTQNDKDITVSVADDIHLTSVTTGKTRISDQGVQIGNGSKQVSLTENGLDNGGNTISNVAPGVNGTDAVNVDQLNNALGNVSNTNQRIKTLNNRVDRVEDHANAGIAQAMATASLPQAYLPGKSMMSMSGGFYRGETGYAIGLSTVSDKGNWVFKVSGSGNSRGNYGGTIGAGYQW